ncbi:MAG: sodium/proton-translocating pyrophosphatase, partial [Candidatus Omnitrophica bacterium]|nr:sodium/proton-translocating pyrophosphatase [Candidatus Omnitrophota bacterium]
MDNLFFFTPLCAVLALVFALVLTFKIFKEDEGSDRMKEIASAVREGANAYLKRQFGSVAVFFFIVFIILLILVKKGLLEPLVPYAFLTGGIFSGLSGFFGMKIATNSSARTANVCQTSLNKGLRLAFSSGAVMGFTVVGLGLLSLTGWYYLLDWYYTDHAPEGISKLAAITNTMLCVGMGASFMALFARVGGGIFTKAADVGADLVGKVEAGIPEDDPRNPATIADNVGDNVGDVAGMGADLFESYIGSIVATSVLGVAAGLGVNGFVVPAVLASIGILASMFGSF